MGASVRRPLLALAGVTLLTLPWLGVRFGGILSSTGVPTVIVLSGLAVIGAAFLLTWGAETAEVDVPRSFALAVLAVIAVAPEYAVDALFAWEAGQNPGTPAAENAANLAIANMTGANRILIGLGWSLIALYAIVRAARSRDATVSTRAGFLNDAVDLHPRIGTEIVFLGVATLYAFLVPLNGGIDIIDAVVLVGLYAAYILVILQGKEPHEPQLGVPGFLQRLPRGKRVFIVLLLFAYSAAVILLAVKPFARGLEAIGPELGLSSFFMIQWVAPLASESPEFIATAYLVRKLRTTAAFNALISSKLNQWTLLIGTLVVVYSLSLGSYDVLSFNRRQAAEIWLTAAQSLFAVALIVDFRLSVREALALLGLFVVQFLPVLQQYEGLLLWSGVYLVLAIVILIRRRSWIPEVIAVTRARAAGQDPSIDRSRHEDPRA